MGDLLLHVFRRAGQHILPILPGLLHALVTRLSTALTATFSQILILPFAYLIGNQADVVLNLLQNIHIDGRSGSEILLVAWCDTADFIQGYWNNRVRCEAALTSTPHCLILLVMQYICIEQASAAAHARS